MMKNALRIALLLCLLAPAVGAENMPVATATVLKDKARIAFAWPQATKIAARMHGNSLLIAFDAKADPDFGVILKQLHPYVVGAERREGGKTIVLLLDRPYPIRTFASGNINGVEIMKLGSSETALATLSPTAGEEAATPPPAAPEEKPEEKTAEKPGEKPADPAPQAEARAVEEQKPEMPEPKPVIAEGGDGQPPPDAAPTPPDRVVVSVSPAKDNAVIRLPFAQRTALAAFVRERTLWIAWNRTIPADLKDFDELSPTVVGKAEIVPTQNATVIRMPIDDGVYVGVAREEGSFDWAVLVTPKKRDLNKMLNLQVNTDPPVLPHVLIPCLEYADPITVIDPQVGDTLVITPFFSVGEGMPVKRQFIEFSVLETAQGVAVAKKAEDTAVQALRNGLRISTPRGASLTPGLPILEQAKLTGTLQQAATLFPYDFWKPEDPSKQREQLRQLFHRIVEAENVQDANDARLRSAQIYLSQGMGTEAIAFLDGINRTNPAFYRSSKLAALRGSANFLMHRFIDAAHDFAASELNNNKETDYWRSMLADLLGNPDQVYDYLALNNDYISKYPPIFRQRLAIVAADRAIGAKDYNTALKIFDTLTVDNLTDPIHHYVNFLIAKIAADTGQEDEALKTWEELAADYEHPFVRARAEFAYILKQIERNALSKDEAIDRLERLRLAWHGDTLELSILVMLGDLYAERRDYVNAMRVWNGGVIAFPNTSQALDMSRKMQEAFIGMFNEGVADKLPPLEALGLYYEYRNYTPTGNTGNEIVNRLADRLVSVDLLNQAALLLDHQMRFAAEKEKRSDLGTRLAMVYLMNHQPAKALSALQDSVYGDNPLTLRLLRNRLTAQALVDLGEMDKALQTLGQDNSVDAAHIRVAVYWHTKNWPQLITTVESVLKARKDITAPVTLEESEYLLRLALAYIFQNDRVQLQYLHDYFSPLMANNPNREIFEFVAGGDIPVTTTNFDDVIKRIGDTRSFINTYSARVSAAAPTTPVASAAN